jgi:hypothetical protein
MEIFNVPPTLCKDTYILVILSCEEVQSSEQMGSDRKTSILKDREKVLK